MPLSDEILASQPIEMDLRLPEASDGLLILELQTSATPPVALIHGADAGTMTLQAADGTDLLSLPAQVSPSGSTIRAAFRTATFPVRGASESIGTWWLHLSAGADAAKQTRLVFKGRIFAEYGPEPQS